MTAGTPWSVKGIDPKAREIAKDLARREGMTLGEWLNRMIMDDEQDSLIETRPDRSSSHTPGSISAREPSARLEIPRHPADDSGRVSLAIEALSRRIEAAEDRSASAVSSIERSVRDALSRIDNTGRDQTAVSARFDSSILTLHDHQQRIADRLKKIESDAAGPRSAEALQALETAIIKVAQRAQDTDSTFSDSLARIEQQVEEITATHLPADQLLGQITGRLEAAEARTGEALRDLGLSFAALDRRLKSVETSTGAMIEGQLETLALDLKSRIEAARQEMADQLRRSTDGRFARIDSTLGELSLHVRAAEQQSVGAIERMGREVIGLAETMGRRIGHLEERTTAANDKFGSEIARISTVMESRFAHSESTQTSALEKLGSEIAKITETLSERIANSNRRNAAALDEVGTQVARVSDRLSERAERTSDELNQRIRQSEDRTARLLEEARQKIEVGLAASALRQAAELSPPAQPDSRSRAAVLLESDFDAGLEGDIDSFLTPAEPVRASAFASKPQIVLADEDARGEVAQFEDDADNVIKPVVVSVPVPPATVPAVSKATIPDQVFDSLEDFEAALNRPAAGVSAATGTSFPDPSVPSAAGSAASAELDELLQAFEAPVEHKPAVPPPATPLSTRDVVSQIRAASRNQDGGPDLDPHTKPKPAKTPPASIFKGLKIGGRGRKSGNTTLSTALVVTGTAAVVGSGVAAYWLQSNINNSGAAQQTAQASRNPAASNGSTTAMPAASAVTADGQMPIQAAIAIDPQPLGSSAPGTAANAPLQPGNPSSRLGSPSSSTGAPRQVSTTESGSGAEMYRDAIRRLESGDRSGVDTLRKAANLGHAGAQFYLAKLHETGDQGVGRSMTEARRWTERAALGGDRTAMHNLGLYYFEGAGGSKSASTAAQWFRKAAEQGLVDSQYNLGRLYEEGLGVSQNVAEAYKWYSIAGRNGDPEAKSSATRLKSKLSPDAQTVAERSAGTFQPVKPPARQVTASADAVPSAGVLTTQKALTRLGYYVGPSDGQASAALSMAVKAWQKDQSLDASGVIDANVVNRLAPFTR